MIFWYNLTSVIMYKVLCMLVGYMRVSPENEEQNTEQYNALIPAGINYLNIYQDQDKTNGVKPRRFGLKRALEFLIEGDCLVVWKLDLLNLSRRHLININSQLKERGIGFKSLTRNTIDISDTSMYRGRGRASLLNQKMAEIQEALSAGKTKSSICRNLDVSHSTLSIALKRKSN